MRKWNSILRSCFPDLLKLRRMNLLVLSFQNKPKILLWWNMTKFSPGVPAQITRLERSGITLRIKKRRKKRNTRKFLERTGLQSIEFNHNCWHNCITNLNVLRDYTTVVEMQTI